MIHKLITLEPLTPYLARFYAVAAMVALGATLCWSPGVGLWHERLYEKVQHSLQHLLLALAAAAIALPIAWLLVTLGAASIHKRWRAIEPQLLHLLAWVFISSAALSVPDHPRSASIAVVLWLSLHLLVISTWVTGLASHAQRQTNTHTLLALGANRKVAVALQQRLIFSNHHRAIFLALFANVWGQMLGALLLVLVTSADRSGWPFFVPTIVLYALCRRRLLAPLRGAWA